MVFAEMRASSRWAAWVLLLGLLALVAGCGGGGGSSPGGVVTGASIRGRVVDDGSGQPVANATVTAGGRSTRTKTDGTFSVAADPGSVSYSVTANNYFTAKFSAAVQAD